MRKGIENPKGRPTTAVNYRRTNGTVQSSSENSISVLGLQGRGCTSINNDVHFDLGMPVETFY
jgi:hypothetical protein